MYTDTRTRARGRRGNPNTRPRMTDAEFAARANHRYCVRQIARRVVQDTYRDLEAGKVSFNPAHLSLPSEWQRALIDIRSEERPYPAYSSFMIDGEFYTPYYSLYLDNLNGAEYIGWKLREALDKVFRGRDTFESPLHLAMRRHLIAATS